MIKRGWTSAVAVATLALAPAALAQTPTDSGQPVASPPPTGEAAPPPVETAPPPRKKGVPVSGMYDGGLVVRSDDGSFELKVNGLLQARYELVNRPTPMETDPDDTTTDSRFLIPRSRLGASGYVWKNTQFKIEFAFSDAGNTRLRDFYVNQLFLGGKLQLRAGQWKRPFNRNEIVSDFATEFLEKAITNQFGSRDIGVGLTNGYDKSPDGLEWVVALFNGNGDTVRFPVTCTVPVGSTVPSCTVGTPTNTPAGNFRPELQARVGWNHGGIRGYSEGDLEGGPLRFAVGVSYRGTNLQNLDSLPIRHDLDIDAVVKVAGLDVWGAFFLIKNKDVDSQFAFHAQAGYMVLPKTLQVAGRFAMFPLAAPTGDADQEYTQEVRGAISWYFTRSHNYKWATDLGFTKDTTEGADATILLRSGLQLIL